MKWIKEHKALTLTALIALIIVALVLFAIFGPQYIGPQSNVQFLGDRVSLHEDYFATAKSFEEHDEITIIESQNSEITHSLSSPDKHYLQVLVKIERQQIQNERKNHLLDKNDFKIKDHTGVEIGIFNFQSVKEGLALSQKEFSTTTSIEDYSWVGASVEPGEYAEFCISFEIDKDLSAFETIIILEIDFFIGRGANSGIDILLGLNNEEPDLTSTQ